MPQILKAWTVAAILSLMLVWPAPVSRAAASPEVQASFPAFPVTVNGTITDQAHSQYPLLLYRDITYFPMTWNYTSSLGLAVSWSKENGLSLDKKDGCVPLSQDLTAEVNANSGGSQTVVPAPFPVKVNGKTIVNADEPYPVLLYRNIVYFPMTWRFAHEEFNWKTSWDNVRGFAIQSCARLDDEERTQAEALNLANGGQLAVKNGWVYMNPYLWSEGAHQLVKSKPDGSSQTKLSDDKATSINVVGDWLYYIASEPRKPNAIYKIKTDGTERTLVSQTNASGLWVRDGWMYYLRLAERSGNENAPYYTPGGIERMRMDSSEKQTLLSSMDHIKYFFLQGERLYYLTGEGEKKKLYVMGNNGSGQTELRDNVTEISIIDGWIYYVQDGKQLRKMSADGSVDIPLHEPARTPIFGLNYRDGWVYYVSGGFGISGYASMERIRLDGTGRQALAEARATALYIAEDQLYFPYWSMGDRTMYHMKIDDPQP
ncbi:DUF5050 domain-containing protein [Paenibacillus oleatilyticus]|uniref:DUF5050 domain-containing protein n=1 Tax=Paenibacillus oleatilyticus TaxID=2594886 RepID=UPI001C1FE47F|nr:DUF5050 domain-containing protein [Paenibacillus oleatilyticus]MBU7314761.1 DUF5050 domain-containing protein [Paenibacillus oleatilyticus]